jgi:predicted permease
MPEPFGSLSGIFIIAGFGVLLYRMGWVSNSSVRFLSHLIIDMALPFSILYTITEHVNFYEFTDFRTIVLIPFISIGVNYACSILLSQILRIKNTQQGLFVSMCSNSNSLFFGLPVNNAILGPASLPLAYIFYVISTFYFNSLGIILLSRSNNSHLSIRYALKQLITPINIAFALAIALSAAKMRLSPFLSGVCNTIGSMSTPLSLLFIGISMCETKLDHLRFSKQISVVPIARFIISPLIALIVANALGASPLSRNVMVLQSALPVMTSTPIFSRQYNADTDYATLATTLTAIMSFAVIPLYSLLFF